MEWITQLLKDAPAAAKYRTQLETLAREHAALQAENARLADELAWFIPQWDTLDGDAVRTLEYLSRVEHAEAAEIAAANKVNAQIPETYLAYLAKGRYVQAPTDGGRRYAISAKGRRYLSDRGLPRN